MSSTLTAIAPCALAAAFITAGLALLTLSAITALARAWTRAWLWSATLMSSAALIGVRVTAGALALGVLAALTVVVTVLVRSLPPY